MNDEYLVSFEGKIKPYEFNQFISSVVYLPAKFHKQLPLKENPRLRVQGFIDSKPFELALQPTGRNRWYIMLSKRMLKLIQKDVGETIFVMFDIADQDHVDIPKELDNALNANAKARKQWDSLTPGKRRSLAHRVESAKKYETKQRRVMEIVEQLLET